MPTATAVRELTVTRRGVELVSVGRWDASTGKTTVKLADLQAMIEASKNEAYDAPPLKIGHDDDRFQDAAGNPPSTRDGEPAYGWIENLRLSVDKTTLLGDFVGVPKMLGDVMDTALRRRSVELVRHDRVGDTTYAAVLTGVALLGVAAPAVKGLADLRALFATQLDVAPERFSIEVQADTPTVPHSTDPNPDGEQETRSTDNPEAFTMKLSKMQRSALGIADDASEEEIAAALSKLGLKMTEDAGTPPVAVTPAAPPAPAVIVGTPAAPVAAPPATAPVAAPVAPVAAPAPVPVAASAPAPATAPQHVELTAANVAASAQQLGLLVVDPRMYESLSADAAAGREARDEQNRIARDAVIQKAVSDGKIANAAYSAFRSQIDKDPDGVTVLLAAMPPARVPMSTPIGHGEAFTGGVPSDAQTQADELSARRKMLASHFSIPETAKG